MISGIFAVIILVLILGIVMVSLIGNALGGFVSSDSPQYSENTLQDYADARYSAEFGGSMAYEDNILLVFLTEEETVDYYFIAWVGDHIERDINYLFGGNDTELGSAINNTVNFQSYRYSLDSDLASVVEQMGEKIKRMGFDDSYTCAEEHIQVQSRLVNRTSLSLTEETVNAALRKFTEDTGIPMVIVVDDMEEVFGSESGGVSPALLIVGVLLIVVVIVLISRAGKGKKTAAEDPASATTEE